MGNAAPHHAVEADNTWYAAQPESSDRQAGRIRTLEDRLAAHQGQVGWIEGLELGGVVRVALHTKPP